MLLLFALRVFCFLSVSLLSLSRLLLLNLNLEKRNSNLQEARRRAPADEPKITIDDLRNGSYGKRVEGKRGGGWGKRKSASSLFHLCRRLFFNPFALLLFLNFSTMKKLLKKQDPALAGPMLLTSPRSLEACLEQGIVGFVFLSFSHEGAREQRRKARRELTDFFLFPLSPLPSPLSPLSNNNNNDDDDANRTRASSTPEARQRPDTPPAAASGPPRQRSPPLPPRPRPLPSFPLLRRPVPSPQPRRRHSSRPRSPRRWRGSSASAGRPPVAPRWRRRRGSARH